MACDKCNNKSCNGCKNCNCSSGAITTQNSPCTTPCSIPKGCDSIISDECVIRPEYCIEVNIGGSLVYIPSGVSQEVINQIILLALQSPNGLSSIGPNCPIVPYVDVDLYNGALVIRFLPVYVQTSSVLNYNILVTNQTTGVQYTVATLTPSQLSIVNGLAVVNVNPTGGIPLNNGDVYIIQIKTTSTNGTCYSLKYYYKVGGGCKTLKST